MNSSLEAQTVFYSWQSDLENRTNRTFIQDALQQAVDGVLESELEIDLVVDRDTQNTPGAPDVAKTILSKIDRAIIVVADISIINKGSKERPTPNPNVLFELGYGVHALSWDNVLPVFNLATGRIEDLPFDLRSRRPITYTMTMDVGDKKPEQKKLTRTLQAALQLCIKESLKKKSQIQFVVQLYPYMRIGIRNLGAISVQVQKFSIEYPKSIDKNGEPIASRPPLVRVQAGRYEDKTATWKITLVKTETPIWGCIDNWRLPPQIDPREVEIFEHPALVFKETASREAVIKLSLSLSQGHPVQVTTTLGQLLDPNGSFAL